MSESHWAHWCKGEGLEIGASSHNAFGLTTRNVDAHPGFPAFVDEQKRLAGRVAPVDIVAFAHDIPVASGSVDFVISSHVLEHVANPLAALIEWDRVVRCGGIVYMIVPHPDRTFDKGKPITTLAHVIVDAAVMRTEDPNSGPLGHEHVWRLPDLVAVIDWAVKKGWLNWTIVDTEDPDSKVGNGFTIVCRKECEDAT